MIASYRVIGSPPPRRGHALQLSDPWVSHESWYVDSAHAAVAALWLDGELWLMGDAVHVITGGVEVLLSPRDEAPPHVVAPLRASWVKLLPEIGSRHVVSSGVADEAVTLVLDVVDDPVPDDLPTWLATLRECEVDLTWTGNESGPGLLHAIRRPMGTESNVRAALLEHASENAEIADLVAEEPTGGWVEDLDLDTIASNISGSAGAWLDPGTQHARTAWRCVVSGAAILEALRTHVEQPTIVAVHSAPVDSVVCVHLIGGIDRVSGDLVGFALRRVWT